MSGDHMMPSRLVCVEPSERLHRGIQGASGSAARTDDTSAPTIGHTCRAQLIICSLVDSLPGTVVRYADEHGGDTDRSYRVVFSWDEAAGTVDVKLSAVMPGHPPAKMETIHTDRLKVIAYCGSDGNIEYA
jgi:hypothetical protein